MKKKIYVLGSSSNELSELRKNRYTRKIVNDQISRHVPEVTDDATESAKALNITTIRIKKNRINIFNAAIGETTTDSTNNDEVKKLLEVNLIAKAVGLLLDSNSVLKNMKGEDAVNLIAKQAQNVQEDGSVSDLQTPQAAYDSAVRNFGKQLVDAAIKANPLFSFLKPAVNIAMAFDNSLQANIISPVSSGKIKSADSPACTLPDYSKKGSITKRRSLIFDIN